MKFLSFILLLVLACASPAGAQLPALLKLPAAAPAKPAEPVAPPAPPAPVLSPAQAQAVLDVLQNDQKRAQFVTVLQNIAKVQAAQAPQAGIKLKPGSLGAQLLQETSGAIGQASAQLLLAARAVTDFPALWRWVHAVAEDPDIEARLYDAAWRLVVVVVVGGIAEYLCLRGLARWRDGVGRGAPHDETPIPEQAQVPEEAPATGEPAEEVAPRKPSSWALLRRVPYVLLRLLIDLAPIGAFTIVVYGLLATPLGADRDARLVILGLLNAYIILRGCMSLVRMMLSPNSTSLRLLHMSDASAAYLVRWSRRFLSVAIFGYAFDQTGLLFGMNDQLHDALLKVFGLVLHIFALIVVLQCRRKVARRLRAPKGAHGVWAVARNRLAEVWHVIAIFYIVAVWLVAAFEVRNGFSVLWHYFIIAMAVLAIARLISIVLLGALDRSLHLTPETLARYPGLDSKTRRYQPALRVLINGTIVVVAWVVLLQLWGVPIDTVIRRGSLGGRMVFALATSALVILLAVVVWETTNAMIEGHLARLAREEQYARSARLRTLLPMLRTTLMVVIFVFAGLMVLSQVGVNTAPLLAGAGVVGIAVGFGSQKLVQDVITGLFLLLENTMQVGDMVSLASLTGTVENLSIRTIRLRATDGSVHMIPFSSVTTVTNQTRDYSYAVLDVTAGYNEEPDHISEVLRGVAAEMKEDAYWGSTLEGEIDVMGVDKFLDNAWVLRARIKTQPPKRWAVQREFNRRLKYKFDELAIESPFTSPRILSTVPGPPEPTPEAAS